MCSSDGDGVFLRCLALVCTRWHSAVIGTAHLWSVIVWHFPFPEPEIPRPGRRSTAGSGSWRWRTSKEGALKWLATCLERSQTSPLYIFLNLTDSQHNRDGIWDLMAPHLHRCSALFIKEEQGFFGVVDWPLVEEAFATRVLYEDEGMFAYRDVILDNTEISLKKRWAPGFNKHLLFCDVLTHY